jgi:hypothetical protein
LPQWERMRVYYVVPRNDDWTPPKGRTELYTNDGFIVWGPASHER